MQVCNHTKKLISEAITVRLEPESRRFIKYPYWHLLKRVHALRTFPDGSMSSKENPGFIEFSPFMGMGGVGKERSFFEHSPKRKLEWLD
ncbi:uncharacterized protein LOC132307018 isoform X2 [Cornus florida]|uniref:uncharacterized protein LOC132307018 isoform X2 n=1 Tax=Cornus florida TaxID=4283 RepID=UPI0028984F58|nr:uncharacterized protein LOC132307018 isoform X2 [Cornus florida]